MKTLLLLGLTIISMSYAQTTLEVGFLLEAPLLEHGLSRSHEQARLKLDDLEWLNTHAAVITAEHVEIAIEQLFIANTDIIIATSEHFREAMLDVAQGHPNKLFVVQGEATELSNVASLQVDLSDSLYLLGIIAGALSITDKVAFLSPPEKDFHSLQQGLYLSQPEAQLFTHLLPLKLDVHFAQQATQALIDRGADVFIFMEDSEAVLRQAARRGLPSFAYATAMVDPEHEYIVSGQLFHWQLAYEYILNLVHEGHFHSDNFNSLNLNWGLAEGLVSLGSNQENLVHKDYIFALEQHLINLPDGRKLSSYALLLEEYDRLRQ